MNLVIWHNPDCGTSRSVLAALRERGLAPRIVEYLKMPPTRAELADVVKRMGTPARHLVRAKEPLHAELGLDAPAVGEDALLDAMAAHPVLINRPVVIAGGRALLCRPAERVNELF